MPRVKDGFVSCFWRNTLTLAVLLNNTIGALFLVGNLSIFEAQPGTEIGNPVTEKPTYEGVSRDLEMIIRHRKHGAVFEIQRMGFLTEQH